mmetsp:Transcript_1351/g.5538  ORF Transcript_1351/g.5538 Transcript_1351/m.5538 type:complete len:214 (+) Transcript_1351:594-1235(+)
MNPKTMIIFIHFVRVYTVAAHSGTRTRMGGTSCAPASSSASMRSVLNVPTERHSRRIKNRVWFTSMRPLFALTLSPQAKVLKYSDSSPNSMSPRRKPPTIFRLNRSVSPSMLHVPASNFVGVNAPVAMGSTTPLSLNSMAIGHTKRMPDCPHAGGIQVPDSRPMSAYTRQRVPTSASGSASAYANRRARFFDTSSDRLCARRTLYTTPPMTLH